MPSSQVYGRVMYLLLPATDPEASASFYRDVFGWTIRDTREGLAFTDGAGSIHGRWVTDRVADPDPGVLAFISVRDSRETEARIVEHGGEIVESSDPDAFDVLTIFRDPSGNIFGTYQLKPGDDG